MHRASFLPPLLVLPALVACSRHERAPATSNLPVFGVHVVRVVAAEELRLEELTGTIRPARQAVIAAKIMGTVTAVDVVLGQEVRAGDTLIEIKAAEIDARVEQAEAAYAQADRDHERESKLLAQGASTNETVRSLLERKRQAAAALAEAVAMKEYTRLTAPFDGVVARKQVDVGDLTTPGTALLYLDSRDALRAEFGLPQSLAPLEPGAELEVRAGPVSARGRLSEVSSAADPASRTVLAKVDLPASARFRSGQFVRVLVPAGTIPCLEVPASAVSLRGQIERAFVVENGRALLRIVRTARAESGDELRVLAGLAEGEIVVAPVPAGLRDGQPVEVVR